jgi:hypothetical protein
MDQRMASRAAPDPALEGDPLWYMDAIIYHST